MAMYCVRKNLGQGSLTSQYLAALRIEDPVVGQVVVKLTMHVLQCMLY